MIAYGYSAAGGSLEELEKCTIVVSLWDRQRVCAMLEELLLAAPRMLSPASSVGRDGRVSTIARVARISADALCVLLNGQRRGFGRSQELRDAFLIMDDEDWSVLVLMVGELKSEQRTEDSGAVCTEWHFRFRKADWSEGESDLVVVQKEVAG